ncbi:glycoside hydrolase family 140 protein [Larkinella soli]|uniref:glycoside hydrolase family 140 protein n=1 Tax=Larkinella soli TaxID=1770527 RepID=UPI000FFC9FB4|nr:glycoside hydrolase family 140 protein [Larkinella soli]
MKTRFTTLVCCALATAASFAQTPFSHGRLRVSDNGRYLVHQDNTPFFYLGDTAWELFHRLNRDEADRYLKRRAEQGFTVVQAVALAELDGLNTPNANGDKPLTDNDPAKPNEAYFQHVDWIVDKAASYGIVVGLLPTWGDKLHKSTWGAGPEIFNTDNARGFGRWIAKRYAGRDNIIWILGGDRNPREGTQDVAVWRAMAEGIQEGAGGPDRALISYHPQPTGDIPVGGSAKWFHQDSWLDFNMFQNGHCRDTPVWDHIAGVYDLKPVKPVMDAEPIYEDHPVCFNAKDLGTSNAYDVRKVAYLDLFAGAHGHTYGCHDIWQMYAPNRQPVNGPHMPWYEAVELPGAGQMGHIRRLIESRPVLDRIPDQSLLVDPITNPAERQQATRGRDYAFVYSAAGKPFTLNMGRISGAEVTATWFDPRSGKTKTAGSFPNRNRQTFTPPDSGYGHDWVLILDDATKKYALPVAANQQKP